MQYDLQQIWRNTHDCLLACLLKSVSSAVTLIACQVVATHLPPEEIEGIKQMFMDLDIDNSGTISFEELREGESVVLLCCSCQGQGGGMW